MTTKQISGGGVHEMPDDLRNALIADKEVLEKWEGLTPLARNEWICWTITVKQAETRKKHIERTVAELLEGKRRPCCWMGCIHRTDKSISPSVQWVLNKQSKS
jgi:Bacteriocin-protection, YdeI or OmpD-Associated